MAKLYIKNMVCDRCIMAVRSRLDELGLNPVSVQLGEVELAEEPAPEQTEAIGRSLSRIGFELIDDRRSRIIEKIRNVVVELVHHSDAPPLLKQSEYIASRLNYDYHYLSKLFSETEGITIEQYIINQKVEKVKELLTYGELNLNEIADKLGYSSVQHLSQQFKKTTGLTATEFKKLKDPGRKPLDQI